MQKLFPCSCSSSSTSSSSSSSSSSNPSFVLFFTSQNPSFHSFPHSLAPPPPRCSPRDSTTPAHDQASVAALTYSNSGAAAPERLPVVRRPAKELSAGADEARSSIDAGLAEFARKMPIFEPGERVGLAGSAEKPLVVNLDLALYRAKVLSRNFRYAEAEEILRKVRFFFFFFVLR